MTKSIAAIRATRDYIQDFNPKQQPKKRKDTFKVTILEDLDFGWTDADVEQFREMWTNGIGIDAISRALKRDVDEVALLVFHEARQGRIVPRPGGVHGGE